MAETNWADIGVDRSWAGQATAEGLCTRIKLYMTLNSNDSLICNLHHCFHVSLYVWPSHWVGR